jgi:hypothetical protein
MEKITMNNDRTIPNNPGDVRIKAGKRLPIPDDIRAYLLDGLKARYGNICWYCGIALQSKQIHIDHIDPLSKGGSHDISNMALACVNCNRAKWNTTPIRFFEWLKRIRRVEPFPAAEHFRAAFDSAENFRQDIDLTEAQRQASRYEATEKWKRKAFRKFGRCCKCCRENYFKFLVFDYIGKGDLDHKKQFKSAEAFYQWVVEDDTADQRVMLMCMNCSWARNKFGECPHDKEEFYETKDVIEPEKKDFKESLEISKRIALGRGQKWTFD